MHPNFSKYESCSVGIRPSEGQHMKAHYEPHILYIEDDDDSCLMMSELLGLSGIRVTCAHGIRDAQRTPEKGRFDLFLLDVRLKDGDGNDLCRELRSAYPHIPVAFFTGCAYENEREMGLAAGAADYVVKPYCDLVGPMILNLTNPIPEIPAYHASPDQFRLAA